MIFFAAVMAALYHLGAIQPVVRLFARLFRRSLRLSGAEALVESATAALAPSRRDDLAALGLRAFLASTLATVMTGAVAGVLYHGQQGVLGI